MGVGLDAADEVGLSRVEDSHKVGELLLEKCSDGLGGSLLASSWSLIGK